VDFNLTEEQQDFRDFVREWVDREAPKSAALEWERHEHQFPFELWDKFTAAGFHGIGIPEEYGGQGGDTVTQMVLARELARNLAGLTWVWGITSFAGGKSVGLYGSEEQKQKYIPRICAGEDKWAIGFTEPGGGTDVLGGMRTIAKKVDGGWVINGQKTWSSMSHVADYILLLARTNENVRKAPSRPHAVHPTPPSLRVLRSVRSPSWACVLWVRATCSSMMSSCRTRTFSGR